MSTHFIPCRRRHLIAGAAILLLLAAGRAALADVMSLPLADVALGHDAGFVWSGIEEAPQFQLSEWGSEIVHLPGAIAIAAPGSSVALPTQAVWIFEAPPPGEPRARFGLRHAQTLVPIVPAGAVGTASGFGASVAGGGDWLFVGAPNTSVDGVANAGAVHVFRRAAPSGPYEPFRILSNPVPSESFYGRALAFDGATLVIGTPRRRASPDAPISGGADLHDVDTWAIGAARSFVAPLIAGNGAFVGERAAVDGAHFIVAQPTWNLGGGEVDFIVRTDASLAIEATLLPAPDQTGTLFGASLAAGGGRFAVGAPNEDADGLEDCGVVRIYTRSGSPEKGVWTARHVIVGSAAGAGAARVAMDGDLLAIGGAGTPPPPGSGLWTGRATLLRIEDESLETLAVAQGFSEGCFARRSLGLRVALGDGRWSFTERILSGPTNERSVRSVPIDGAFSDCDGDGISDLSEVLAGAADRDHDGRPDSCVGDDVEDCDADGIADAAATMPLVELPCGMEAIWVGIAMGSPAQTAARRAFLLVQSAEVPADGDGTLIGVETDFARVIVAESQPLIVAIYADPNQDGDPDDAVLLRANRAAVSSAPGRDRILVEPVALGPPGTRYFLGIGAIKNAGAAASLYARSVQPFPTPDFTCWVVHAQNLVADLLDIEHLSANDIFEPFVGLSGYDSIAAVGIFTNPIDLNGDGAPDSCACIGDLDGDGIVGPSDLAILLSSWGESGAADLDGDGVVGAGDIATLLGRWGSGPGGC